MTVGDKNVTLSNAKKFLLKIDTIWYTQKKSKNYNMYEFWGISYNQTKSVQCTKLIESSKILFFLNSMFMAHIAHLPIFMSAL